MRQDLNFADWKTVKQILNAALDLEPGEREVYLAEACAGDEGLRRRVEELLSSYRSEFMEKPVAAEPEPSDDLVIPSRLGRYEIIRMIGAGGMVSLAQAGFVTLAALVTGLLLSHDVPFVVAAAVGVAAAAAAGALVALPSIRLGGLALALATLALALIGERVLFAWDKLGNSSSGWRIPRPKLGEMDTELFREFFQAFAQNAGITLHVENLYGENSHHIAETCFKGLARALREAVAIDPRQAGRVPSTKGTL